MKQIYDSVYGNNIFAIIGRNEIESILDILPNNLALITITDPNLDCIKHNNKFDKTLAIKFYDVEEDFGNYKTLSDLQGKIIYDFIQQNKDRQFIINCEAGVSRSAGVGLAVEYLLRDLFIYPKWEHFPSKILSHTRYLPNMTVFNKIIQNEKEK